MPTFTFELEAVLRQRKRAEEAQQRVVAELERERIALENEIRACHGRIRGEKLDLTERLDAAGRGDAVDLGLVRVQANASLHAMAEAQRAVLRLSGVHQRLDRARLDLLERSIDRRSMESLRDKRREEWERGRRRAEDAALDEITVTRHAQRVTPDGADHDGQEAA